jgi:hypothetical protein
MKVKTQCYQEPAERQLNMQKKMALILYYGHSRGLERILLGVCAPYFKTCTCTCYDCKGIKINLSVSGQF